MRSLRTRLALAFGAVVLASVIATALLTGRVATVRMEHMMSGGVENGAVQAAARLSRHYRRDEAWSDPRPVLDSLASELGRPIVLVLPDGSVRAAPADVERGLRVGVRDGELWVERSSVGMGGEATGVVLRGGVPATGAGGAIVGRVVVFPRPGPPLPSPVQSRASFLRSLALAAAIAVVAGLALAWLVARRIAGPVEQLTGAVRRLEAGEPGARVAPRGNDELASLAGAFNAMAERVERTEKLRRDLVNDVAHELRTPLTHLRGRLEAMEDGLVPAEAAAFAELNDEVGHLTRLVADLQEMAAADGGALRVELQPLTLASEIEAAIRPFQARADERGVAFAVDAPPALPTVRADARRLRQILSNLIDNALRHAPPGTAVDILARRAGDEVQVSVRDRGPGIPPEHLPNVFERFYRADASRSRDTGGVGLGLAIVRQLVEAHGGRVTASNADGGGARLEFTLPRA